MRRSGPRSITISIGGALVATMLAAPQAAHAVATIYVSPAGTGTTCSAAAPCGLRTAFTDAVSGDEIVMASGSYRTPSTPYTDDLNDTNRALFIHGIAGQPLPVINIASTYGVALHDGSHLRDVAIVSTGGAYGLNAQPGTTIDHVAVSSSVSGGVACGVYGSLTDSVCTTSGSGGQAFALSSGASAADTEDIAISNVTAVSTGADSYGVADLAGLNVTLNLTLINTIAKGTAADIEAISQDPTAHANVIVNHGDYATIHRDSTAGGTTSITPTAQVTAAPVFVAAATGDYREASTSPTIDKGTTTATTTTDTDLANGPRVLGSAPDIGAYERPEAPSVAKLKVAKVTKQAAHLTVRVNPAGLSTTAMLTASHHGHHTTSPAKAVGAGLKPVKVTVVLHGLKPDAHYSVHVTATNSAGHVATPHLKVHTKH